MKAWNILLFSLAFLLLSSGFASAALNVEVSLPSQTLTENNQVPVSVTVTNTGNAESNIITTLTSSPAWFSITSQCTTISSLQKDQSGTSSCIITPTSTGSGFSLAATVQSAGGTSGSGSTGGISVSPAASSITAQMYSPSSVGTSSIFFSSVTVTAPYDTDSSNVRVTASASGSGCALDTAQVPATQNLGTVPKGTSKSSTNWKLTSVSYYSTCTVSVNVVSDNSGTANPSRSITVGSPPGGISATGQSVLLATQDTGLLGLEETKTTVSAQTGKATITISFLAAGKTGTAVIPKSPGMPVSQIAVTARNAVSNVQITVLKLDARPAGVSQEAAGRVYNYIQVDKANMTDADVSNARIGFKVGKAWLESNSIDESTVSLQRHDGSIWQKLITKKTGSDAESVLYEAESPGLSVFAITGEAKAKAPEVPITGQVPKAGEAIEYLGLIAIVAVAVFAAVLFFLKGMLQRRARSQAGQ